MNYPASLDVTTPERIANWRPLVQWLLGIPHLIISQVLGYVAQALAVLSWFIIIFTGRLPDGIARFQVMILRYSTRASLYAGFMYDAYPPFDFSMTNEEPGGSPVDLAVAPVLEGRNRLTVGFRIILAIPALIFVVLVGILGAICWFLGFFAILFTGRWPEGLRKWALISQRCSIRLQAYMLLLTDEYPPFAAE